MGRLSWTFGLLSTGQAAPRPGDEKALRMCLRYLCVDAEVSE